MSDRKITYEFLESNGLVNHVGVEIETYYDPVKGTFEVYDPDSSWKENGYTKKEFSRFILLPYDDEYSRAAWKPFYERLTEEETELAQSYPYRRGYFGYLRETGLIYIYEAAKDDVAADVIAAWEKSNGISPNWEHAHIC